MNLDSESRRNTCFPLSIFAVGLAGFVLGLFSRPALWGEALRPPSHPAIGLQRAGEAAPAAARLPQIGEATGGPAEIGGPPSAVAPQEPAPLPSPGAAGDGPAHLGAGGVDVGAARPAAPSAGPASEPSAPQGVVASSQAQPAGPRAASPPEQLQAVWGCLRRPNTDPRNITYNGKYSGQVKQDAWVDGVFNQATGLFVVESGANAPVFQSNSVFLEVQRNWSCLLVEANPYFAAGIVEANRHCYLLEGGLSIGDGIGSFQFRLAGDLSGFSDTTDAKHKHRQDVEVGRENKHPDFVGEKGSGRFVEVKAFPLHLVMEAIGRSTVDYWSLDVEGAEKTILEHTDFTKVEVGVMTIEHNNDKPRKDAIYAEMMRVGFVRVDVGTGRLANLDDFYANPAYFAKRGLPMPAGSPPAPAAAGALPPAAPTAPAAPDAAASAPSAPQAVAAPEAPAAPSPAAASPEQQQLVRSCLRQPGTGPRNITWNGEYQGQVGQDRWVDRLFNRATGLFVVESGANAPVFQSNSIFLEVERDWSCLLVEANPYFAAGIVAANRHCYLLEGGLSISGGVGSFSFRLAGDLSGFNDTTDRKHRSRQDKELGREVRHPDFVGEQGSGRYVEVKAFPLHLVMETIGRSTVDFWSLDVEGAETKILASTDFNRLEVGVMAIEWSGDKNRRESIFQEMSKAGFVRADLGTGSKAGLDDFYMNPAYFAKRGLEMPTGFTP